MTAGLLLDQKARALRIMTYNSLQVRQGEDVIQGELVEGGQLSLIGSPSHENPKPDR